MEGGFSKKNLKRFLFSHSKKNWSFLIAAIILETLAFYISSNGVIESIPKSPIAVIVGLVIFLQATILYIIKAVRGTWNFVWQQATLVQGCTSEA